MALIGILAGVFVVAASSGARPDDRYTAMYMNTSAVDRNITKDKTTVSIPFYIENHEGTKVAYNYSVSILFKDTIYHAGTDAWSEDLNVDQEFNVTKGNVTVDNGKTAMVTLSVPVRSDQKWRNANVTIALYKEGTTGEYRSLRLWAINQVK